MAIDGSITLPFPELEALGPNDGAVNLGDPESIGDPFYSITRMTLEADALTGGAHDALITFRALSLLADSVTGKVATAELLLEPLTLDGALDGPLPLDEMTLDAVLLTGELAHGDALLPDITLDAALLAGGSGDGALELPQLVVEGSTGAAASASLEALALSALGVAGSAIDGALRWSAFDSAGTMLQEGEGSGAVAFQLLGVDANGTASAVGSAVISLSLLALDAVAVRGNVLTASLTLPLFGLDGSGQMDVFGSASVTLPALLLDAQLEQELVAPVFSGVVVNTRTGAATTYNGVAANSLCRFNGLTLAATSDGIVALMGDTDLGTPITAQLAGGVTDFASDQFKRVLAGYVGYQAGGQLELTLITDGHHEYVYQLEPRNMDVQHASRVKFGRGVDGRYWQWCLANRAGVDFAVDAITLDVQELHKRIG